MALLLPARMLTATWLVSAALLTACEGTKGSADTSPPKCDGKLQVDEGTVDAPFDADGDGYFDGNNPDCAATYPRNVLDCDDTDPNVNPGATEIPCNGIDDDCNPATLDSADRDGDGSTDCEDCDDNNPLRSPLLDEICYDGIDNNCDGVIDEGCGPNYAGTFAINPQPDFQCGSLPLMGPMHTARFDRVSFIYNAPLLSMLQIGSDTPPPLDGTVNDETGAFSVGYVVEQAGACNQYFSLVGTFTDADNFTATLSLVWQGNFTSPCFGCTAYELAITGERMP